MKFKIVIGILLLNIVVSLSAIAIYDQFFVRKIVTVDIKGHVEELRELYVKDSINEKELERELKYLDDFIARIPDNMIVLTKSAVIKNAKVIKP